MKEYNKPEITIVSLDTVDSTNVTISSIQTSINSKDFSQMVEF